jgi:hypothetical protein
MKGAATAGVAGGPPEGEEARVALREEAVNVEQSERA